MVIVYHKNSDKIVILIILLKIVAISQPLFQTRRVRFPKRTRWQLWSNRQTGKQANVSATQRSRQPAAVMFFSGLILERVSSVIAESVVSF